MKSKIVLITGAFLTSAKFCGISEFCAKWKFNGLA